MQLSMIVTIVNIINFTTIVLNVQHRPMGGIDSCILLLNELLLILFVGYGKHKIVKLLAKYLSLDDRQLAHFALGDTQQQNGVHDKSFLR